MREEGQGGRDEGVSVFLCGRGGVAGRGAGWGGLVVLTQQTVPGG